MAELRRYREMGLSVNKISAIMGCNRNLLGRMLTQAKQAEPGVDI
jgi:hypothetical protein